MRGKDGSMSKAQIKKQLSSKLKAIGGLNENEEPPSSMLINLSKVVMDKVQDGVGNHEHLNAFLKHLN